VSSADVLLRTNPSVSPVSSVVEKVFLIADS